MKLQGLVVSGEITLVISESCLANLICLSYDIYKIQDSKERLLDFIKICEVIACGKQRILEAIQSPFKDKEDAIQYYTALGFGADYFITRNLKDYKSAIKSLPVVTPVQFID